MVAEQMRKRKIRSFAKDRDRGWAQLEDFVNRRCKPKKDRDNILDELSKLIDWYIDFNLQIYCWCRKNGVDVSGFMCDVCNCDSDSRNLINKETNTRRRRHECRTS